MNIKECIKLKEETVNHNIKIENALYEILYEVLYESYEDIEEMKEQYVLWENLECDEFEFNYKFGNIDMTEINIINKRFNKEGFMLKSISDCEVRANKKGLILYFRKTESEDK